MSEKDRPADDPGRFSASSAEFSETGPLPFLVVGEVLGPHGLGGVMRVRPLTDFPERFRDIRTIHVGESLRPYAVESAEVTDATVMLKLAGVDTADAVLQLRGVRLRIPRSQAVPLPEGQYYFDQIIGLDVVTTGGERLGRVAEILRTGANDVYIIRGPRGQILIPAIEDVIKEVRLEQGELVVEPLPGLIE